MLLEQFATVMMNAWMTLSAVTEHLQMNLDHATFQQFLYICVSIFICINPASMYTYSRWAVLLIWFDLVRKASNQHSFFMNP